MCAVEAKRGCGWRKSGGLYLVTGGGIGEPCERLPISLAECPCCRRRSIEQTRSTQWVGAQFIFGQALPCHKGDEADKDPGHHGRCVLCNEKLMAEADPQDQFLILWIGKQHYATPADWTAESNKMGVSRRVAALPKGLVMGKTWVLVAHPEAVRQDCKTCDGKGWVKDGKDGSKTCTVCDGKRFKMEAGIFHAFRPHACELVVTPSMKKQGWVKKLVKKHKVELVEVPEDDPDHAPTATKKSARKRAMDKHGRKHAKKKGWKPRPEKPPQEEVA